MTDNIFMAILSKIKKISTKVDAVDANVSTAVTNANKAATNAANANTNANAAKTNTATNNTASKTGTLSQKDSYIISLLENSTYGLNALKSTFGSGVAPSFRSAIAASAFKTSVVGKTSVDIINIQGKGTLYFGNAWSDVPITIVIDGVTIVNGVDFITSGSTNTTDAVCIEFKQSAKITYDNSISSSTRNVFCAYVLY